MSKKTFLILILPALILVGGYLIRQATATSNPHTWTNGLVGYWSFDGQYTTSTNGTRDVSNNGNWGAFNGGVKPTAGVVGQALSFDGVDDYVDAGTGASLNFTTNDFSIETWFKTTASGREVIVSDYQTGLGGVLGDTGYSFEAEGTALQATVANNNDADYSSLSATVSPNDGNWHHAILTRSGTTYKLFFDGKQVATDTTTNILNISNSFNPYIGRATWASVLYWNGLIDEVRIYNRALSADEVKQHYDQTRRNLVINQPTGTPPVGWWKMDESPTSNGSIIHDYAANANNGTVSNGGYGATSTDGKIGKALNFDGGNDFVTITPVTQLLTSDFTYSVWFKSSGTTEQLIFWHGAGFTPRFFLDLRGDGGGAIQWNIHDGTNTAGNYISGVNYTDGNWHFIVITLDRDGYGRTYMDGLSIGTPQDLTAVGSITDSATLFVGSQSGTSGFFNGLIDDVRLYNYARTAEQIANDYRTGIYRTTIAASNPHDWSNGLVAYWNFDGPNTTTTSGANAGTRDASGNNNWGAFSGGVKPVAGIVGQALSFDGLDDYINIPNSATIKMGILDFTIEFWMKTTGTTAVNVLWQGPFGPRYFVDYRGDFSNKVIRANIYDGANSVTFQSASAVGDGAWHHVVVVFDRDGNGQIYIDGQINGAAVDISAVGNIDNNDPLRIGCSYDLSSNFSGSIDEVRIYSRALSADEVIQHYQQTRRNLGL